MTDSAQILELPIIFPLVTYMLQLWSHICYNLKIPGHIYTTRIQASFSLNPLLHKDMVQILSEMASWSHICDSYICTIGRASWDG